MVFLTHVQCMCMHHLKGVIINIVHVLDPRPLSTDQQYGIYVPVPPTYSQGGNEVEKLEERGRQHVHAAAIMGITISASGLHRHAASNKREGAGHSYKNNYTLDMQ